MALSHKVSDVVNQRIDTDDFGNPVLELEMRYVRYRLTIDNEEKARKLIKLLNTALADTTKHTVQKDQSMPKFYKTEDERAP